MERELEYGGALIPLFNLYLLIGLGI